MAPSITTIQTNFYNVLYSSSDAASVAVRAYLGAGANSVLKAEQLNVETLPAMVNGPLIALRWGAIGGPRDDVQRFYPTWHLYDTLQRYWDRINALIPLIQAAYPLEILPYCETNWSTASAEITDNSLNLRHKAIPFVISTR